MAYSADVILNKGKLHGYQERQVLQSPSWQRQ